MYSSLGVSYDSGSVFLAEAKADDAVACFKRFNIQDAV